MNPEDVFRDVKRAIHEERRVRVSRSEVNGRIRWVIEIEDKPLLTQFNTRMRDFLDRMSGASDEVREDREQGEESNDWKERWR
jgi:hypothetical protein